jgi:hypothetical protein
VLSVYLRRARLPEPGEIVFCTSHTTLEEIDLLLRRFISGTRVLVSVIDCPHTLSHLSGLVRLPCVPYAPLHSAVRIFSLFARVFLACLPSSLQ